MSSIFLAHSSKDNRFARRLANDLKKHGIKAWLDEAEIKVGDSLIEKIERAIHQTEYIGVILSPNSIRSKWVKKEVEIALHEEIQGKKVKVIPILYRDCKVPGFLKTKLWAEFRGPRSYSKGLKQLINRLLPVGELRGILGKPWSPKAVRLGLECGLLKISKGNVEFSTRFIKSICNESRKWIEDGTSLKDDYRVEILFLAVAKAASKGTLVVPLYETELAFLANEMSLQWAAHMIKVGTKARVLEVTGDVVSLKLDLSNEIFETIGEHGDEEITSKSDIRPFVANLFIQAVRARLIINLNDDSNICYPLGLFTYSFFDDKGLVEEFEGLILGRVRTKKKAQKRSPRQPKTDS